MNDLTVDDEFVDADAILADVLAGGEDALGMNLADLADGLLDACEEPLNEEGQTIGTFYVDDLELALEANTVREVVPYPKTVTKVPLSPRTVHGLFSLRGEILPILDMGRVLGMESTLSPEDRRIAVVQTDNGHVGVVFDRTGEVLQIQPDSVFPMRFGTAEQGAVIDGVIQIEGSGRSIQKLSASLLGGLEGVPFSGGRDGKALHGVDTTVYRKAVVARVGDYELAFEMDDLVEIQPALSVQPAPEYFEHCVGVVEVRGRLHAVMDLRAALGLPNCDAPDRLIFVERDGVTIALEVDALVETVEYPEGAPLETPPLPGSGLDTLCKALLLLEGERHVLFIDLARMFARYSIAQSASILGARAETTADDDVESLVDDERSLLTFYVGDQFLSLDMVDVLEVQGLPSDVLLARSTDESLVGAMGLRGQVIPLIDLGRRLGVTGNHDLVSGNEPLPMGGPELGSSLEGVAELGEPETGNVVIVVEAQGGTHGLVVDRVHSITRFQRSRSTVATETLASAGSGSSLLGCVESAVLLEGPGRDAGMYVILDAGKVIALGS